MIAEKYVGIRPAPGYPACPEHVVKTDMFRVLDGEDIGMMLTDSYAMYPASSVSGFYFSHPQSQYFNVGVIGEDQLEDYARRSAQHRGPAPHAGAEPGLSGTGGIRAARPRPDPLVSQYPRHCRGNVPTQVPTRQAFAARASARRRRPAQHGRASRWTAPCGPRPAGRRSPSPPASLPPTARRDVQPGRPALLPGSVLRIRRMKCSMPLACASAVIGSTGSVGNSSASRRWLAKALL